MADSLDTLSTATGLSRDTLLELWEKAQANRVLLDACPRHAFERSVGPNGPRLGDKFRCVVCGGEASADSVIWYEKGLAHGRAG